MREGNEGGLEWRGRKFGATEEIRRQILQGLGRARAPADVRGQTKLRLHPDR